MKIQFNHELLSNDFQNLSFCPIVSSIVTYNDNIAKFLSELLDPVIPNEHCAKDSFIFCEQIQGVSVNEYILVLYEFDLDEVLLCRRYVDDNFFMFKNEINAEDFFNYLNSKHFNIKFTMENEANKVFIIFRCSC